MKGTFADPYVYPGTRILRNLCDIRDIDELQQFERLSTAQRLREGLPDIALTPKGYLSLHRHLFQDVYAWAGKVRTVAIAKENAMFCMPDYIAAELERRFAKIREQDGCRNLDSAGFALAAADHIAELNAIHPFRDGNGRTNRAFLVMFGRQAGHIVSIARIDPDAWNQASRESFRNGSLSLMCEVISATLIPQENKG